MSYARFLNTDVYVYESESGFECCGCKIYGGLTLATRQEMIEHMRNHIAWGHNTGDVIEVLEEEIKDGLQ